MKKHEHKQFQIENKAKRAMQMGAIAAMMVISGGGNPVLASESIPLAVPEATTKDNIEIDSNGDDIKGAINVRGTVNHATVNFSNGSMSINGSDSYRYSTILSGAGGLIGELNAVFDSNNISVTEHKETSGTLIKAIGDITNANLYIKNNTLIGDGNITGSMVTVESTGKIQSITGQGFQDNSVSVTSNSDIIGGVLLNQGTIGDISNTNFSNNEASSDTGSISGVAFANTGNFSGNIQNVNFTGNTASSSSGTVKGGAIYNTGIFSGKIVNSSFTNNQLVSNKGLAYGGAIYSTTDLTISADGGNSIFRDNKVIDSTGTKNQAIYIDSRIAKLTLDAKNNGQILIYDDIDGFEGYNLTLQGDATGKIGLYGNVNNANVTVSGGNIDFINNETTDFNFGQFTSSNSAKYSIDLDVSTGRADTFTIGTGSSGTIIIDAINKLGTLPDESTQIKILNAPTFDSVEIALTDKAINAFNSTGTKKVTWSDEVPTDMSWGDTLNKYERNDTVQRTISAVSSTFGGKNDSLQYTVTTTEGTTTSSIMGDTLRLMNQSNSTGARNFSANPSRNTHTITENLGSTGTGTFNIIGVRDAEHGEITSLIDADNHTMFILDKASTLSLSDIQISNANAAAGSLLNVTNKGAIVNLSNVLVDATNGTNAIINNGTLNVTGSNFNTSITGTGTTNIKGGTIRLEAGSDITQSVINITNGGQLAVYGLDNKLNAAINVSSGGTLNVYANNIGGNVVNNGSFLLYQGTLDNTVSGTGTTTIYQTVIANNRIGNKITMTEGSSLTISADNVGGDITHFNNASNRSVLHLGAGTLDYQVKNFWGSTIIEGDVTANAMMETLKNITSGNSLTINATNMGTYNTSGNDTNNGTLYLTGGTLNRGIAGSGTIHIVGDVSTRRTDTINNPGITNNVIIDDGATLTSGAGRFTGGTITNNSVLNLTDGTLSRVVSGTGTTNITGAVTSNASIGTITSIASAGTLTINASNLGGELSNAGNLTLTGGTLNKTIEGAGKTIFTTGRTTLQAAINQAMEIKSGGGITTNADFIGGNITGVTATTLTGGTLRYNISGAAVSNNSTVVFDEGAYINGTFSIYTGSKVYANASQFSANTLWLDGDLYLGDGRHIGNAYNSGTLHIVGNVTGGNTIMSGVKTIIEEGGVYTHNINSINGTLTNNGVFNMSGTLTKNIAGTGTTKINNTTIFDSGASIAGTLDFNNGILNIGNRVVENYEVGNLAGAGTWSLDLDAASGLADTLTLSAASNVNITPDITLLNVSSPFTNKVFKIIDGETSGIRYTLPDISNGINLVNRDEDFVTSANVNFNDRYEIRDLTGKGTGSVSIATTDNANDSLSVTVNNIIWGDTVVTKKDLFHDWLLYETSEDKSFNFNTATDVYNVIDSNYSHNIAGTVSINGVSDGTNWSKINFGSKFVQLVVTSDGKLNLSNVELTNLGFSQGKNKIIINSGGWANFDNIKYTNNRNEQNIQNNGTIDNVSGIFNNNGASHNILNTGVINKVSALFSNSVCYNAVLYNNGGTIHSIDGASFESNYYGDSTSRYALLNNGTIDSITNTTFLKNYYNLNSSLTAGGYALQNSSGKTITFFDSNIFDGNYMRSSNATSYALAQGGALRNLGTFTNGITNTQFTGNYIDTSGGYGGALFNSGTIKVIDGTTFTNNRVVYHPYQGRQGQGGALYNSGTITEGIKNSRFEGNYVINSNTNVGANATYDVYGGAIYNASSTPLLIENTDFIGNYVSTASAGGHPRGGALYGAFTITGGLFEGNYTEGKNGYVRGGAIYIHKGSIAGATFRNNHSGSQGGAVGYYGTVSHIDGLFEDNYAGSGGAMCGEGVITELSGTFINNRATGSGGAISNTYNGHITKLYDATFTGNSAGSVGGAISNEVSYAYGTTRGIEQIVNSNFTGNNAVSRGGAISSSYTFINEISNSVFEGNYLNSTGAAQGGAIGITSASRITNGIYNSTFLNNYVLGKTTAAGGAIWSASTSNLLIGARDNGKTEFTGNYVQLNGGEKRYEAIYINDRTNTLTLEATTGGTLLFNDSINGGYSGTDGYQTTITGDGTGKLQLFNNIYNSNIIADNITIDTVNNSIFDYNFLSLNTAKTVKYGIDIDLTNGLADNFTVGYGSTGTMTIDNINFIGGTSGNKKFQILKNNRSDVQLELAKTSYGIYNVVDNFLEDAVPDTVYNDGIYKQQKGLILSSTDTYHDTIEIITSETQYDSLDIIGGKETSNARNFVFRDNANSSINHTLSKDLSNITAGTLNILGLDNKETTIDANGHKLFNLTEETALNISNTNITGTEDVITVSNAYATVNLSNTNITGNIKGSSNFKINLSGNENNLNGKVENATATLNSGILTFNKDTFSGTGTKLVTNGGTVDLQNDLVENIVINDLTSNANANYKLDVNLNNLTSDTITVNGNASGVVTISDLNYLGSMTLDDVGKHPIKVLNTSSGSITLALSDAVKDSSFNLGDIRRDEQDTVAMITNFNTVYYNRYRLGNIVGKLSISEDSKDSITIDAIDQWSNTSTATSVLGDTLQLVAKADMPIRILQAESSLDTYNVAGDIGTVAAGELVISGVNDGEEISTINLANHQGFVLGANTSLSINSTRVIGSDTPIEVTSSSASVELNDAYLSGGIKADTTYNLNLIGNGITTVNGTLTNAQATLSKGGFIFNEDTFAGANTSLTVDAGSVLMNDGITKDYEFNKLVSNAGANYSIDVDLANNKADTFNIKTGSGVVTLASVNIMGGIIEANKDYTVKVLNTNGNAVTLALSDTLLSQMGSVFKLGSCITTEYETINPITKWNTIYYKDETSHDVYGTFRVNTAKDSLIVTPNRIDAMGTQTLVWGDTLRLLNELETTTARQFNFDTATDVYNVTENLGTTTAGTLTVNGKSSGSNLSTINADGNTLFDLSNNSTLNLNNVKITNGRASAGSIINITNSNAKANLNNVTINSTGGGNGINNAGILTLTGTNNINTGISGTSGVLNINNGALVNIGANSNITQATVNVNNGSLILDASDIIYGTLNVGVSGNAQMSAGAVTHTASNAGQLTLTGGTLAYGVNGTGTTNVNGTVTSYSAINQALKINTGSSLTISADNIGGVVTNANNISLTGGTLTKIISGVGTTNITGNVTSNALISQNISIGTNGGLTTSASNIGGEVTNVRDLNLTGGTLNKNISGTGRTNIDGNVTVNSTITNNSIHLNSGVLQLTNDSDISKASQLNVHGGAIDLQNEGISDTNLGNVVLNGDMNLALDVDLGNKTGDKITASSLSNADNHSIIIDTIKILSDPVENLPIEIVVADGILRSAVKLSEEAITISGKAAQTSYLVTYSKGTGKLTFGYGDLSTAIILTAAERQYNLTGNENSDLGVENGNNSTLTVFGHNYAINVNVGKQWTIGNGKTVNLNNLTMQNATVAAILNSGILNLNTVTFNNNLKDITNSGTIKLTGSNSLNVIDGNGNTLIADGVTTLNRTMAQNLLNVNEDAEYVNVGSAIITTVTNSGTVKNSGTIKGALNNSGAVDNSNTITLSGGTNSGTISGTGTTIVDGTYTNTGVLTQKITVNANKTLTNNNALNITGGTNAGTINGTGTVNLNGTFANSGTMSVNLENSGTLTNSKNLTLTGGQNAGTINGTGTTTVDGAFTNNSIINQSVSVNANKTLTNAGTVTGTVNNSGTIANNNALNITGGTNAGTISGAGTTTVDGAFTNNSIINQSVSVNANKTLTNAGTVTGAVNNSGTIANNNALNVTDGQNAGTINGAGTTTVNGNYTNSGTISQSVSVNANKTLTNAGTVTGTVNNSGTIANNNALNVTGGTNAGTINGTGTTTVNGNYTNSGTISQSVSVNANKTLTNAGTVTGAVNNSGTIANNNALNITGGTNAGTINGTGTTTVNGNYTNSGTISQSVSVNANKTLTNVGTVTGTVNNSGTIANNNALNVTGGTNSGTINGAGTTTVNGNYTNSGTISQSVSVNANKTLTNAGTVTGAVNNSGTIANNNALNVTGGQNDGTINGTGTVTVIENFDNNGTLIQNTVTINNGKILTNNSSGNVIVDTTLANNGTIDNDGTVTVKGINNLGSVSGEGTLNAEGTITVNKLITQNKVNVAANTLLTNNAGINANITNIGTLDNNAALRGIVTNQTNGTINSSATNLLGNVVNNGSLVLEGGNYGNFVISGTGSTVITADMVNNGAISQNRVTLNENKTLVNNSGKTVTAIESFTNSGNITNEGYMNVANLTNNKDSAISNIGVVNINGGANFGVISGDGSTNLSGNVLNKGSINQLIVNNSGILTNDGSISGKVTNSGTIDNNATITGPITNQSDGVINSLGNNLLGDITNDGLLNLNGGKTQGSINGTGTTNVTGELVVNNSISGNTLVLGADSNTTLSDKGSLTLGGFIANGGSLNVQNNKIDVLELGNVVLNNDVTISVDADLAQKTGDRITGSSITANGNHIIIDSINILTDATSDMPLDINFADSILKDSVQLSAESIGVLGVKEDANYLVTYSTSTGNLTFTYGDLNSAVHLTANQRNYTMSADEIITKDLGTMEDGQDVLSINGNNHNILGNGHNGITVNNGNTLNVNNVNEMRDFFVALNNAFDGTINIKNTNFTNNDTDIINAGTLNFAGVNSLDTIEGIGTTTVKNGQTTINVSLEQNKVAINASGELINKGTIDVETFENAGRLTNKGEVIVDNITNNSDALISNDGTIKGALNNSGAVDNSNTITLSGGTNSGTISGTGTTIVDGTYTNTGVLTQKITVNANKTLTNNNALNITGGTNAGTINGTGTVNLNGTFANSGTMSVNLENSGTLTNSKNLTLTGGQNAGTINGTGTTTVDGAFTNNSIINQSVSVNANKTLTNAGTVTGTVNNSGTIANNNALNITGGTNAGTINGTGTVKLNGTFVNSGTMSVNLENSGTLTNSKNLTLTGGQNAGTINGTGTTTVDGAFTNNSTISQSVSVNANKTLTNAGTVTGTVNNSGTIANNNALNITGGTNAGTINGTGTVKLNGTFSNAGTMSVNLENSGTLTNSKNLTLTGGQNAGTINGTGTTTVDGAFTNNSTINQSVSVNANKTLTNAGTVTGAVNNSGTIVNDNKLNIQGGKNDGTIIGSGNASISGSITNNGTITQASLTNSGNLTNNGAINANLTNSGNISNNAAITGNITNTQAGMLTSNANYLIGTIANSGTLNLIGGETQNTISGTNGTINVEGNLTVSHKVSGNTLTLNTDSTTTINNGGSLVLNGLNANGGSLNAKNDNQDIINLGNVVLNSDMKFAVDVDLDNKWTDTLTADKVSGSYNIVIDSINILTDSSDKIPLSLTVANGILKDHVKLDEAFKVSTSDVVEDSYFISYEKENGVLNFEYLTLAAAVKSHTDQKVYVMNKDEVINSDFGKLNGSSLSINGNNNRIEGSGNVEGIILDENKTLSLNELTYSGFNTAVTNNGGTVNITDTTFESNETDILNDGTVNFYGKDTVNKIEGDGILNIGSYKEADGTIVNAEVTLTQDGSITQNTVNIQADNKLLNNGTVTSEYFNNSGIVENNNKLNLNSGSNTGEISGAGHMQVNGEFTSTGTINQNTLNVTEGAEFTASLDKIITTDNKITNSGILYAADGVNTLNIEGSGRTEIKGEVTNNGLISQTTVTVAEGGKLTTSLNNLITEDIQNSGELNVTDTKIEKDINGTETGVLNINHTMFLNSKIKGTGISLNNGSRLDFGAHADLTQTSNFIVNSGNIQMINNYAGDVINLGKHMTMNGDLDLSVDVDLANVSMDKVTAESISGDGYINIKSMNMLSDGKEEQTRVQFASDALKNNVKTDVKSISYSPIWVYGVDYDKQNGQFVFTKGGNGGSIGGFNPAVVASPVNAQIAGNVTMSQTISEAFQHSDWFSRLNQAERYARINNTRFAINSSTDFNGNLGKIDPAHSNQGFWTRPYSTFESVRLTNGPKVNLISYGTIVGGDSDFRHHKNGWASVSSAYVGYHGAQFNYSGSNATSNGGVLGVTETFYKGNFFTALTATAGASFTETHNMYGKEDLPMLMAGVASKSGYNFEFNEGKFIIQPNLLMSYSFISPFDDTNSGGVKIDNEPMHTFQLNPSLRFIGNTKNNWQPYATIGMMWNIMNHTHSSANGITLPEMSTKPYIEYGIGLQKLCSDYFSAYGQATVRHGGRNGIALTAGFKWSLGKDSKPIDHVYAPVPEKMLTQEETKILAPIPVSSKIKSAKPEVQVLPTTEKKIIKQMSQAQRAAYEKQTTKATTIGIIKNL